MGERVDAAAVENCRCIRKQLPAQSGNRRLYQRRMYRRSKARNAENALKVFGALTLNFRNRHEFLEIVALKPLNCPGSAKRITPVVTVIAINITPFILVPYITLLNV